MIERREVLASGGPKIAAGTFDPKHFGRVPVEWVFFKNFGRGVSAAGIGYSLIGTEKIGSIDESADRIAARCLFIIPSVADVLIWLHYFNLTGERALRFHEPVGASPGPEFADYRQPRLPNSWGNEPT